MISMEVADDVQAHDQTVGAAAAAFVSHVIADLQLEVASARWLLTVPALAKAAVALFSAVIAALTAVCSAAALTGAAAAGAAAGAGAGGHRGGVAVLAAASSAASGAGFGSVIIFLGSLP